MHVIRSDAGLGGLWQPEGFADVLSLEDWEGSVLDDGALAERISAGLFVPLNVGGDGAWQVALRFGAVRPREEKYLLVASEPYLLVSNGVIELGGLENVGSYVGGSIRIPVPAGRYQVRVNLIEWDAEPGAATSEGLPTDIALPDFVVLVNPDDGSVGNFRTSVETFDRPSCQD